LSATFSIREATAADLDSIVALRRQLVEGDPNPVLMDALTGREGVLELLGDSSIGKLWIGFDGPAIVGYILLTFSFSLEFGGRNAFIDELVVDRRFRGNGFGESLLAFAEDRARQAGIKAIHLEVTPSNLAAVALYRKRDYREHARLLMTRWL
jgi:ribosomal protein S18 acetylase RimI-like enzyme